ncbi:hypothetical protein [Streptomyces collinus]|uniref:hypothetical protein n=1 Tax=Streptomyces collinus TaxID=42684 RepID=UPI003628E57A
MRHRITAIILLAASLALAGCSSESHEPDPAACKRAIKAQYEPGTAKLKGKPGTPRECDGLSDDQVSKIVLSVVQENTK